MTVSLETLLKKFKPLNNADFEGRHFMTNLPWRGQYSYLHTLFDAAEDEVQASTIDRLCLPSNLRQFYRRYNGAHMFSDNFSLYGFFPRTYLFERENWRKRWPYNIIQTNQEYFKDVYVSPLFVVGSYGFDRSEVVIEKSTGEVYCSVGDDLTKARKSWPSFEVWLTEEIARMCDFFDEEGHPLVDSEDMLPKIEIQ